MNLLNYNNKYIILTNFQNQKVLGMGYYMDKDTYEEKEDILTVLSDDDKQYYAFYESEIKDIEILE